MEYRGAPRLSSLNSSLMLPLGDEMDAGVAAEADNEERERRETKEKRDSPVKSDRAPEKNLIRIGDCIDG